MAVNQVQMIDEESSSAAGVVGQLNGVAKYTSSHMKVLRCCDSEACRPLLGGVLVLRKCLHQGFFLEAELVTGSVKCLSGGSRYCSTSHLVTSDMGSPALGTRRHWVC